MPSEKVAKLHMKGPVLKIDPVPLRKIIIDHGAAPAMHIVEVVEFMQFSSMKELFSDHLKPFLRLCSDLFKGAK